MANEFKIKKGLIVTGATGGTVVNVQGSQGQLFSVTDDLSGSIFAVSDISGVPILDVNSSGLSTFDGSVGIGLTSTTANLEVKSIQDSSFDEGIGVVRSNTSQTGYINMVGGAMNINAPNAIPIKFRDGGNTNLTIGGDGHATFAGNVSGVAGTFTGNLAVGNASAAEIYLNRNSANYINASNAAGYLVFRTGGSTTALTLNATGAGTFGTQAFATTATSSGDASSTLTTKGYVDSLITGATIYRGAWQAGISATSSAATTASTTLTVTAAILDADGNTPVLVGAVVTGEGITGIVKVASVTSSTVYVLDTAIDATATAYIFSPIYGAPSLDGVTQTSGYYYICSEAGSATPNGANSEPNTWNVGDWCIYNDVSGTGQWQKIDNSSVLSGAGTGQTVALWEGPSSVSDSDTLGNAPITVSGNDTTFAGGVNITTVDGLTATGMILNQGSSSRSIYIRGAGNIVQFQDAAANNKWEVVGRDGQYYVYKNDGTGSGMKYQIDGNGNHNFTGVVTLASGSLNLSGTGRIQGVDTVTSNTDAANKLYVDNAVAASGVSTATSLYNLIPNGAFTTTYAFTSTAGTYAEVMSGDDVITSTGTYTVQMVVNDFAVGGTQYDEKYSGVMSWHAGSTNDAGVGSTSEIVLHRSGHAGNQGITYLRTRETTNADNNELKLEIMCNKTYTGASNVVFKFVKLI
jgi:hypothetical protein